MKMFRELYAPMPPQSVATSSNMAVISARKNCRMDLFTERKIKRLLNIHFQLYSARIRF